MFLRKTHNLPKLNYWTAKTFNKTSPSRQILRASKSNWKQVRIKTTTWVHLVKMAELSWVNKSWKAGLNTLANGSTEWGTGTAPKSGPMDPSMRANGKETRRQDKADSSMQTAIFTKGSGAMIRRMVLESISIITGRSTKGNGSKTSNTAGVRKPGRMELITKDFTKLEKNMAKGNSISQMALPMKGSLMSMISMGWAPTFGRTAGNTKAAGGETKCTAKVLRIGQTSGSTSANTRTTKSTAKDSSHGLTEGSTTESGKRASSMERAFL